ncbi:MAG TPA: hypothetical protein VHE36_11875 [Sphingomicrobium sp.]|jgi:hypothetical protein|nr:hypothetical protein [Sphingomicrobium sp.]
MIPMKNSTIFRSRWMALLWAAGIIWFAYDFASSQPSDQNATANAGQSTDDTGSPVTADDEKKLASALNSF